MTSDNVKISGLAGRLPEALRAQAQRSGMGGERRERRGERAPGRGPRSIWLLCRAGLLILMDLPASQLFIDAKGGVFNSGRPRSR